MLSKLVWPAACVLAGTLLFADTAAAQQTVNLTIGGFAPRGLDSRAEGDVLVENEPIYTFDIKDFGGFSVGGEWLYPIGQFLEAGAGIQFTSKNVPTVYRDFVRPNGSEIEQEFKLRTTPISATIRVLPLGKDTLVQPYVGGGIGFINWKYTETGDFVDFTQVGRPVFPAEYEDSGWAVGPVAVFGVKIPVDRFSAGFEVRYQHAKGDLNTDDFLAPKLDLSGFHYQATLGFRF